MIQRRQFLSASAGLLAATLAGCASRPSRRAGSLSPGPPVKLAAMGRSQQAQPVRTPLLDALAVVPNVPALTSAGVSFANFAAIKRLYPEANITGFADLEARGVSVNDYSNATGGCYPSGFMSRLYTYAALAPDLFGFNAFQVGVDVGAGAPPGNLSYLQGSFDDRAIAAKLIADGYATASHSGVDYFSVREDYEIALADPISRIALGHMNRVAASASRIIPVGGTRLMEATIDAELHLAGALDGDLAFQALAAALGDVTSMATVPAAEIERSGQQEWLRVLLSSSSERVARVRQQLTTWGILQAPELVALGYTDFGGYNRTMHVAIVYPAPDIAALDEPELVKRLQGYVLARTGENLLPTYATAVTSRISISASRSVLVADVALVQEAPRGRFWVDMLVVRDILFLLQQPPAL